MDASGLSTRRFLRGLSCPGSSGEFRFSSGLLPALHGFLAVLLTPLVEGLVIAAAGLDHLAGVRVPVGLQGALGAAALDLLLHARVDRGQHLQDIAR